MTDLTEIRSLNTKPLLPIEHLLNHDSETMLKLLLDWQMGKLSLPQYVNIIEQMKEEAAVALSQQYSQRWGHT
jgi:hypothetical protein